MFMFESPATDVLDVQRELAALRAELAEIRRADSEEWMDRARAEHVQSIVRDVLADSSTRRSESGQRWRSDYSAGLGGQRRWQLDHDVWRYSAGEICVFVSVRR